MAKVPANVDRSVKRFLREVARQHRISAAYLYGSQTQGAASAWSDIDVAIISSDFSADLFGEQLALMRIAARIDDRIEPRAFTPDAFTVNDPLASAIQQTGIRVA
jgi:predicted nucleotidyltransferase